MPKVIEEKSCDGVVTRLLLDDKDLPLLRCTLVNNELQSVNNLPALIIYVDNHISKVSFYDKGLLDSFGGLHPTLSYYLPKDGEINPLRRVKSAKWYVKDKLHNRYAYAYVKYRRDRTIYTVKWYHEGLCHRPTEEGPARIIYDKSGKHEIAHFYYTHGCLIKAISLR